MVGPGEGEIDGCAAAQDGGAARAAPLRGRARPQPAGRRPGAAPAGAGQHLPGLHHPADRGRARRPRGRGRGDRAGRGAALRARVRRRAPAGRGAVAGRHPLPEPHDGGRDRAALRVRDERAAREGRGVLPRQLRRVVDEAGARLRRAVRGSRRHAHVRGGRQPRAAGVRVGGPLDLRPGAGRRAGGPDRADRRVHRPARAAPPGARRPARGGHRPGVRARRRQPDEHGDGARVRRGGTRGGRAPEADRRAAQVRDPVLGLQQPADRHRRRGDVRAHQRVGPAGRRRPRPRAARGGDRSRTSGTPPA